MHLNRLATASAGMQNRISFPQHALYERFVDKVGKSDFINQV